MTTDTAARDARIRYHAEAILALVRPAVDVAPIATPEALDAALASCPEGARLTLATSLVYPRRLELVKGVTLQSETHTVSERRMTRDEPAPTFLAGIAATAAGPHNLFGLALHGTDAIGVMGGDGAYWDRCRLLGDPTLGAHRAIQFCGAHGTIARCYMDDVFRPDQDTQAICAWDCGPGLVVEDCYLSAAGQSIMFGGADASDVSRLPTAIRIYDCDLVKNPAWIGRYQVKCALEFKAAIDVEVTGCHLEGGGTSQGQGAFLILATVRNQDGHAPFSTITNVLIRNCTGGPHAAGIANILGTDNVYPSGRLDGLTIRDCDFSDLDGARGHGRLFQLDGSPAHVTLENIRADGINIQSLGYFLSVPAPTGFVAGGLEMPSSVYGWFVDGEVPTYGGRSGHANLQAYMPDAILDDTIV